MGVAAADDQGDQGAGIGERDVHEDRVDVAFEVVDGDEWEVGAEGQGLGEADADEQGSGEARAFGDGYGVELRVGEAGALHGLADDRDDGAEVLAGGEFRDDSAVVAVDELRGDDVGKDLRLAAGAVAVADNGCGGLVAGALDTEDECAGHEVYRTRQGERDSRE